MNKRNLLFAQFGVIAIVAGLHLAGIQYFLYWRLPWFDIPAHLLGGLWAGLFASWILALCGIAPRILFCVGTAFILGAVWELFEAKTGMTSFPRDTLDTIKDLSMDAIGGFAAFYLSLRVTNS